MFRRSRFLALIVVLLTSLDICVADTGPRFVAPTNQQELDARIGELRRHYAPFLQSLPQPLPAPDRIMLPAEWKFTFEAEEKPKQEGVPPAPQWYGVKFDDSQWRTTSVPEWRYRTRMADGAMDPKQLAQWKNPPQATADTICWYRTTFAALAAAEWKRVWLCFDGVDWEAQVYLNGELLGTHCIYYEPFRFDVTGKLKAANTLAVRVIAGRSYGEPMSYWALFPDIRAAEQRYTPNRATSIRGNLPIGYHAGCGFGIHRAVYLERSGPVLIADVFARNDLSSGVARVKVELDAPSAQAAALNVDLLPENFEGAAFHGTMTCNLPQGASAQTLEIPMPDAKVWSPDAPNLYRCRITVTDGVARDVLFGCRSFSIGNGMFLLNGKPVHLRGTNIQGLNAYWYWGQTDELLHTLLMLKAANFNAVRCCQHVEFPEVREWMDRIGMMSEQDQGGGYSGSIDMGIRRAPHIHTGTVLARQTYNNPGVVLLTFGNEHEFPTEPIVRAALAEDPQRIFKPISGRFSHSRKPWDLPPDLRASAVDDGHPYSGWYGNNAPQTWQNLQIYSYPRMVTLGEFGGEALDAYETMRRYPPQFQPPAADADTLWASSQVQKHDVKQIAGLGRDPRNLAEYIEASQNYQEALLADKVTGMRLSPRAIAGYFQFHFIDVVPVFWPKSIVSFDHRPKKAYFQLAQLNQPVVALPQLTGEHPDAMTLWIANDLAQALPQATLHWTLRRDGQTLLEGQQKLDVPAVGAVAGEKIDVSPFAAQHQTFDVVLTVTDSTGHLLSCYQRTIRPVPAQLLKAGPAGATKDPFAGNKPATKE